MTYFPERGDFVWLNFDPQAGHEQAGRRPALTLSPTLYNRPVGMALFCPVTNQAKGYRFEVALPPGFSITGVVQADQVRNLDWKVRQIAFIAKAPPDILAEVLARLDTLLH